MSSLADDWTKGGVLLDYYQKQGDTQALINCCQCVIEAYMNKNTYHNEKRQFKLDSGFIQNSMWSENRDQQITRTLDIWHEACIKYNRTEEAELLSIQRAYFTDSTNWDGFKEAYLKAKNANCDKLKELFIENAVNYSRISYNNGEKNTWISWLLDTVLSSQHELFNKKCKAWLAQKPEIKEASFVSYRNRYTAEYPEYFTIINDVMHVSGNAGTYPRLIKVISSYGINTEGNRRKWLCDVKGEKLYECIMEFIKKNIQLFIPDPGKMSADYKNAAEWLGACQDVAPEVADKILAQWRVEYKRRRNLWGDLGTIGIY